MGKARALLKQRAALIREPVKMDVPQVGEMFYRQLSQSQATDFLDRLKATDGAKNGNAILVAMAVCDETGTLEYDVDAPADIEELNGLDPKTLGFMAEAVRNGNALSKDGAEAAGNASPIVKSS